MAETKTTTSRERTNFSKIRTAIQIPNLIEVQKNSYERFLQMNMLPEEREDTGLQAVFNSVFPISDFPVFRHSSSSATPSETGSASAVT